MSFLLKETLWWAKVPGTIQRRLGLIDGFSFSQKERGRSKRMRGSESQEKKELIISSVSKDHHQWYSDVLKNVRIFIIIGLVPYYYNYHDYCH